LSEPWKVVEGARVVVTTDPHVHAAGHCVAYVFARTDVGRERRARLIAAAPDLLEALKKALNESGCDGDLCAHRWHDVARSAIAKAEGR
jgi:hypothetical protein